MKNIIKINIQFTNKCHKVRSSLSLIWEIKGIFKVIDTPIKFLILLCRKLINKSLCLLKVIKLTIKTAQILTINQRTITRTQISRSALRRYLIHSKNAKSTMIQREKGMVRLWRSRETSPWTALMKKGILIDRI